MSEERDYMFDLFRAGINMRNNVDKTSFEQLKSIAISYGRNENDAASDAETVLNVKQAVEILLQKYADGACATI